ncbi:MULTISPECIES: hypothetical protein [Burkholderia]|uniref:hypothetical protein n=1 Tax=Burkholderia TaxID=32008 RepID=UPI001010CB65|nr:MULTISPECIES: hypothetical protein [Burkholderia]
MNDITSGCLSAIFGSSSNMSPQGLSGGGIMGGLGILQKLKQDIEKLITDMLGMGGGADGGNGGAGDDMGGGYGNGMPMGGNGMPMGGNGMPMGGNGMPMGGNGMPMGGNGMNGDGIQTGGGYGNGMPGDGFGPGQGQGLRDVKFNSPAGGDALHLKMDQNGNLFNGSGNSVGRYDQQTGQLSFNSGASDEIKRLMTGGRDVLGVDSKLAPTEGPGGNAVFSSSQFTMSVGDLNQKADF